MSNRWGGGMRRVTSGNRSQGRTRCTSGLRMKLQSTRSHKGQRQNAPGPAGAAEEQKDSRQRDPDKPGIAQPGEKEHDGIPGRSVQAFAGQ